MMKFLVNRTSQGAVSADPPCAGAERGPESAAWPGEYPWFVELGNLEELIKFLEDNGGGLALWSAGEDEEFPALEILDETEDE